MAPGIPIPDESRTIPLMALVPDCALAAEDASAECERSDEPDKPA